MAAMANQWHACLALERELTDQGAQHSAALTEQRAKWNAALEDLEARPFQHFASATPDVLVLAR